MKRKIRRSMITIDTKKSDFTRSIILMLMFLTVTVLPVSGQQQGSQSLLTDNFQEVKSFYDIPVSIQVEKASLDEIFSQLEKQMGLRFLYNPKVIGKSEHRLDLNFKEVSVADVLTEVALQTGLTFRQINGTITIGVDKLRAPETEMVVAVQQTITGTVVDAETGEELPGVNVIASGTEGSAAPIGTTTDMDGQYELEVPDNVDTLVFTYVGYQRTEVQIDSRTEINVELASDVQMLEDIVVVGYGEVEREDLTSSISSVRANDLENLNVSRADQALMGKVAGVQVKPADGTPGAAPQIRIRGVGSISAGSQPLFVVDGVPTDDIQTVDPSNIESIDILKDASATAIYGSRGANGVVIINTKRGTPGEMNIRFNSSMGFQQVSKIPDQMNAMEQAEYAYYGQKNFNELYGLDTSGDPTEWRIPLPQKILDVLEGRDNTDVNAVEEVLRVAPQNQYRLQFSGGSENLQYAISGEYFNQDGIVKESGYDRYSVRANLDAQLTDRFNVSLNLNPAHTESRGPDPRGIGYGTSILGNATQINPYNSLVDENGDYAVIFGLGETGDFPNPLALANEIVSERQTTRLLGNLTLGYSIMEELNFKVLLGGDLLNSRGMEFVPQLPSILNTTPEGEDETLMSTSWITEATLNYTNNFGNHNVTGLLGFTAQKESGFSNFLESTRYPNNLIPTLSATGGLLTGGTSEAFDWSLVSYLGRFTYNYDSRYYFTASVRTDGSSRFGSDNRYATFPSVSLAWRLSNESFMAHSDIISDLKLRASYGETGNNRIGNYEHLATVENLLYPLGNQPVPGFAPERLPNPTLTWEKQQSINTGIDFGFFNNRIRLTADYFRSTNSSLLLNVNVPSISGFSSALTNIGKVRNTGWELELHTVNSPVSNDFQWTTDFNISTFRNEVLELGPEGDPIIGFAHITQIGEPIGMFYGLIVDGHFKTQEEFEQGPHYAPGTRFGTHLGDIRFKDISGPEGVPDGIIDQNDRTVTGSPYPDFIYGMTNRFSYKSLDLSISLQGSYGNKIFSIPYLALKRGEFRVNQMAELSDFWKSEEEPGTSPRPNNEPTGGQREISTRYLDNGTYLRINNINLSYTVPSSRLSRLSNLDSFRVYANATNPFLFTKFSSFNPDVSASENSLTPGMDNNLYPLATVITLGIDVGF